MKDSDFWTKEKKMKSTIALTYCLGVVSGPLNRERKTKHNLAVLRWQRSEFMEATVARICRTETELCRSAKGSSQAFDWVNTNLHRVRSNFLRLGKEVLDVRKQVTSGSSHGSWISFVPTSQHEETSCSIAPWVESPEESCLGSGLN